MESESRLFFQLILQCFFGIIAAIVAAKKGRSNLGWFLGGFFLGIIGIVIVAVLSNLKEERQRFVQNEAEKRQLQAQLDEEREKVRMHEQYARERPAR